MLARRAGVDAAARTATHGERRRRAHEPTDLRPARSRGALRLRDGVLMKGPPRGRGVYNGCAEDQSKLWMPV